MLLSVVRSSYKSFLYSGVASAFTHTYPVTLRTRCYPTSGAVRCGLALGIIFCWLPVGLSVGLPSATKTSIPRLPAMSNIPKHLLMYLLSPMPYVPCFHTLVSLDLVHSAGSLKKALDNTSAF